MANYQYTFGGLTVGAGQPIGVMSATGIESLPGIRTGDLVVGFKEGQTPGLDISDGRSIHLDLIILDGATDFYTNVEALKTATVTAVNESSFTYQLPGRNARTCNARPRRRDIPIDPEYGMRYGKATIEFYATDPRWYDASFTTTVMSLPTATTGLTFPATASFTFGSAGSGGSASLTNSGNYPAPWVATFTGPIVTPVLTLGSNVMTFNGTVNSGETLVVDSLGQSVLLNGTASRSQWITSSSVWFTIPVGASSVQFTAASGSGSCSFAYRSCWL